MTLCTECKAKIPTLTTRLRRVNSELQLVGLEYPETLGAGLVRVYDILRLQGFTEPEVGYTLPQPDGRIHAEVGEGKWLSVSWHRMESGRYEVVAYVN
jgi:hypothetical protein